MQVVEKEINNKGIMTLVLNRPDKLNALNADVLASLQEAFSQARQDKKIKGILLTGTGKAFCAGADIARLAECNAESGYQFAQDGQAVFKSLETCGKPSLAAINGFAFGGGCELAISASMRIAATTAQFGQPEVKLGVIPGYGGTQRLSRLIGKGRAMDLCLTGRFINAETALQWGLVSEVVEGDTLVARGNDILNGILAMSPIAIQSVLQVIDHGFDMNLQDALHLEAIHFARTCASSDKQEGVSAFLEKRPAQFKGE